MIDKDGSEFFWKDHSFKVASSEAIGFRELSNVWLRIVLRGIFQWKNLVLSLTRLILRFIWWSGNGGGKFG